MKQLLIEHLNDIRKEYERELQNGSMETSIVSDRAKQLHGEIKGLEWCLALLDSKNEVKE